MNYETIIILGAAVYAGLAGYIAYCRSKKPAAEALARTSAKSAPGPAQVEPRRPRLIVAGSQKPATDDTRFLKLFGLAKQPVLDMRFIPGPCTFSGLAPLVSENLAKAYQDGNAVGADVMEFIHHGKALKDNQQLWFVLLSESEGHSTRLVAFVDDIRLAPRFGQ